MIQLSVNVNKIATLRNARGKNRPDLVEVSEKILSYGVHGLTVHPRPDGRHIRKEDVYALAQLIKQKNGIESNVKYELNIEGYPSEEFIELMAEIRPHQCTLVPDPPHVITSNAGWKLRENFSQLTQVVGQLNNLNMRTSLFIDPAEFSKSELEALLKIKPKCIELYTESYADAYGKDNQLEVLARFKNVAEQVTKFDIGINAGHDLNLDNLSFFVKHIPEVMEVSIGHALICDSLDGGLETTVKKYLDCLV